MSHNVTSKQLKAIYLLAKGKSIGEVAQHLKIRRETLSRWRKKPEFNDKLEKVMEDIRAGFKERITHLIDYSLYAATDGLSYGNNPKRTQTALNVLRMLGIDRVLLLNAPEMNTRENREQ
jgi:predicted transcriptional regulator